MQEGNADQVRKRGEGTIQIAQRAGNAVGFLGGVKGPQKSETHT